MPKVELIDLRQPLSWHVLDALRYPLRASALPTLVACTLTHYLSLLPAAGWLLELVIWAATYLYALECLRHSADGFAQPPEFAEPGHGGWTLVAILLWSTLLTLAVKLNFGGGTWLVIQNNFAPVYPFHVMGMTVPCYIALATLLLNLVVSAVLSVVLNAVASDRSRDATVAADYV